MKNLYYSIKSSSKELKNVRSMVIASLLLAIKLLLDFFTIQITPTLHFSFEFLVSASVSSLFGAIPGALCGALSDIINYLLNPKGPFFPGFTVSAIMSGIIYGVAFYKNKITVARCIITELFIVLIIDITLNTLWLSLLYGKGFLVLLPARVIKNVVLIPLKVFMMYVFLNLVDRLKKQYY